MHDSLAHFVTVGLFLTLLSVITRTRKDDRLRCWLASWLCVMAYFAAQNWRPDSPAGTALQSALSASAMAFSAIFFVLSAMILTEHRTAGFRVGLAIALPTLICIWLA